MRICLLLLTAFMSILQCSAMQCNAVWLMQCNVVCVREQFTSLKGHWFEQLKYYG